MVVTWVGVAATAWSAVRAICAGEGGIQVRAEVPCGFEADCESDESVFAEGRGKAGRSLFGVVLVGDECLVVAQGYRRGDDTQVVDEAETVLVRAGDGEGDHASVAAGELGGGAGVLGVVGEAG
jgi:hypothetical protein